MTMRGERMSRRKRGDDEEARDAEKEVGRNMWGGAICEEEEEDRDDDKEKEKDRDDDEEKEKD